MAINTQLSPNLPTENQQKKRKTLHDVVDEALKKAKRITIQPENRTIKTPVKVSFKESRTVSPIPPLIPDKPAVAPGIEYSGFNRTSIKKYG